MTEAVGNNDTHDDKHASVPLDLCAALATPHLVRSAPPQKRGIRVSVSMMQRDEDDNLLPWLQYHSALFGPENLHVWDNGSTSERCRAILSAYEVHGVNVTWDRTTPLDFRRKGELIGQRIKELDRIGGYDFHFPLDCDEFLAVETPTGELRCDPPAIAAHLNELISRTEALGINWAYYNILGHPEWYHRIKHQKTFFRSHTYDWMDHGYHVGRTRAAGRYDTRFVQLHFHFKPYATIVAHSRAKLRGSIDVDDPEVVRREAEKGNRLARFILQSEEEYMKIFTRAGAVSLPVVSKCFENIGAVIPFANCVAPLPAAP